MKSPWEKKIAKQLNPGRTTFGTVVPPSTARPYQFFGPPVLVALGRTVVHLNARSCLACFALVALFLVPRASLYLYSSPESSQNATFLTKPEGSS